MSFCVNAMVGAYQDDKRESLNSLLRVQTPYPVRPKSEELAVRCASCACFPLKCLEGIGMIGFGSLLAVIPCTVCKIVTEHHNNQVDVKKTYPDCRDPQIPCHYKDIYYLENKNIVSEGYSAKCTCTCIPAHPTEPVQNIAAVSSLTGYECLSSGIGKAIAAAASVLCLPVICACIACRNSEA